MSPLAFIQCIIYAYLTGEIDRVLIFSQTHMDRRKAVSLIINGIIAFGLNVVSFTANKKTSALTMTVAANVKQVLTILSAIIIFELVISPMNLLGILITLVGGAFYAKIELERKYSSKIKDVLIIPNNDPGDDDSEHDENNDQHQKLVIIQEGSKTDRLGIGGGGLDEKKHQFNLSSLITSNNNNKRIFQQLPHSNSSIRELEEGSLGGNDPPVLQIISPRWIDAPSL